MVASAPAPTLPAAPSPHLVIAAPRPTRRSPFLEHRDPRAGNRARRALLHLIARLHRWAESGQAGSAVATWNCLQGSVVPGPSEALLIPLGLADPPKAPRLAVWAAIGATIGGLFAYAIGAYALDSVGLPLAGLFGISEMRFRGFEATFVERGAMLVLASTVSPLPTKFVCIAAGAFGVPLAPFLAALAAGRAVRFGVIALVLRYAGDRVMARIERRLRRPIDDVA